MFRLQSSASISHAHLLDIGLPDLCVHPSRCSFGLIYLDPLTQEDVNLLGASLAKPYVCVPPVSCLQGCLTGRLAGEDADLVAFSITQCEVSCFVLFLGYGKASYANK